MVNASFSVHSLLHSQLFLVWWNHNIATSLVLNGFAFNRALFCGPACVGAQELFWNSHALHALTVLCSHKSRSRTVPPACLPACTAHTTTAGCSRYSGSLWVVRGKFAYWPAPCSDMYRSFLSKWPICYVLGWKADYWHFVRFVRIVSIGEMPILGDISTVNVSLSSDFVRFLHLRPFSLGLQEADPSDKRTEAVMSLHFNDCL
jgi:hypothetical protein